MTDRPYSPACEKNRQPIFEVIRHRFTSPGTVLEIGSGTGQHAVSFAPGLPHLTWQCSDRVEYLDGIRQWIAACPSANLPPPMELDVTWPDWPPLEVHGVYSANTSHIMSWDAVQSMFTGVGRILMPNGVFVLYGPFNRNGDFTSESNRRFDAQLRARDEAMGLRDEADLDALAEGAGLRVIERVDMPANNRIIVFKKQ